MAQKIQVLLEDDLDGGEATETISFGLDGTTYEIDLNQKNANALRKALARYVEHARDVRQPRASRPSVKRTRRADSDSAEVREWAKMQGINISSRGRVPAEVVAQFQAASQ